MSNKYNTCPECGVKCVGKHCIKHRKQNPLNRKYKNVYEGWIAKFGIEEANRRKDAANIKRKESLKKMWKNEEYRIKNIAANTGKTRTDEFKKQQSINTTKQMQDPAQIELRSKAMSKSYEEGKIQPIGAGNIYGVKGIWNGIPYMSKGELKRMQLLTNKNINWKRYEVNDFSFKFKYMFEDKEHLYIPDFVLYMNDKIIIEELKQNPNKLSEVEIAKAEAAKIICEQNNIIYRIIKFNSPI